MIAHYAELSAALAAHLAARPAPQPAPSYCSSSEADDSYSDTGSESIISASPTHRHHHHYQSHHPEPARRMSPSRLAHPLIDELDSLSRDRTTSTIPNRPAPSPPQTRSPLRAAKPLTPPTRFWDIPPSPSLRPTTLIDRHLGCFAAVCVLMCLAVVGLLLAVGMCWAEVGRLREVVERQGRVLEEFAAAAAAGATAAPAVIADGLASHQEL
ncbi:hypothetical protein BDK51DRAFT_37087 [Blyttiomyces helicus]|uniref:Uncharacterized protein n=1 Tax=Blyttiomyces helicus TaxID=388810 RepID=A0A4P9W9C5_9FUNG|nr:hypothetical protein BDK51DRAFT_37087 [Blyttiomyces helicus]|eukprot:RKO86806.1 hypothetical protein BDK51DRAFT_37087 [Blyttiomyces helicus]